MKLELTIEETNLILSGLLELPAKFSMGLITNIREQAAKQLEAAREPDQE